MLIQNGVGIEAPHRQRFPKNPLVSVTTIVSAEQIRHGVVRQNRWTRTSLGPYSDGVGGRTAEAKDLAQRGQACTDELGELLTNYGGIEDVERYDEVGMQQVRWHKTSINAAMNPTSVLSGGRGHSSITDPDLRVHLKACMDEVWEAAERVLGAPFPEKLQAASPERILKSIEQNSGGRPSMLMDWEAGRPMEIEVILGNPVRIAKESGYEMRRLQTMYALLKSAQKVRQDARGKEKEKKKGKARQEGSRL